MAIRWGVRGSVGATPAIVLANGTQMGCGRKGLVKFLDQGEI